MSEDEQQPGAVELPEIEAVLVPPLHNLGDNFQVRRALPAPQHKMVGPFIFFDQMGPARFESGRGLDVRPHPHIGLATVTYLFEGEILHRDSVGSVQTIRPGEVNWMTAGRGIAHSERTPPELRQRGGALSGIQVWLALPKAHEEAAPTFTHHDATELPMMQDGGVTLRVIAGTLSGASSPVEVFSSMFYAAAEMEPRSRLELTTEHEERAFYVAKGAVEIRNRRIETGQMVIVKPGHAVTIRSLMLTRLMLLGGEPADGPRHIWWNFVSSSTERIEQAKEDWKAGRFAPVPHETEFIPAPETGAAKVRYP